MASKDRRLPTKPNVRLEIDNTPAPPRLADAKFATILVATPHEIARAGIAALVQAGGHRVVAHCSHEDDVLQCLEIHRPDVVMLDESIIVEDFAKTISRLRTGNRTGIIFLLEESDGTLAANLLNLDVNGILLTWARARSLLDCVDSVARGLTWVDPDLVRHLAMRAERGAQAAGRLTSREDDVAHLVSRGLRNKEIARQLHLSEGTVKMHLHHIYEKLHVGGRMQLALSVVGRRMPTSADDAHCAAAPDGTIAASAVGIVAS